VPGANERIVATMEKEQEHRHRLEKTQMETWSCIMIFKMWILIICPVGVFSIPLVCIYQGKITEGLSLISGSSTGGGCRCNHEDYKRSMIPG